MDQSSALVLLTRSLAEAKAWLRQTARGDWSLRLARVPAQYAFAPTAWSFRQASRVLIPSSDWWLSTDDDAVSVPTLKRPRASSSARAWTTCGRPAGATTCRGTRGVAPGDTVASGVLALAGHPADAGAGPPDQHLPRAANTSPRRHRHLGPARRPDGRHASAGRLRPRLPPIQAHCGARSLWSMAGHRRRPHFGPPSSVPAPAAPPATRPSAASAIPRTSCPPCSSACRRRP